MDTFNEIMGFANHVARDSQLLLFPGLVVILECGLKMSVAVSNCV